MKKFFMIAVMAVAALSASAQQEAGTWNITPKAGINISTLTKADNAKAFVGFAGGVDFGYQATDAFEVTAGLIYSTQGFKYDGADKASKMSYLNIPILANYYVCKGLAIKAGIQPGFLLSAKYDGNDFKDDCKTFDFSIPVGLSYEFSNVILDARYNIGLTKTFKDADEGTKNSVFQITLGYKIGL